MSTNQAIVDDAWERSTVIVESKIVEGTLLRLYVSKGKRYDHYDYAVNVDALRKEFVRLAYSSFQHSGKGNRVRLCCYGLLDLVEDAALPILEQYFDKITIIGN